MTERRDKPTSPREVLFDNNRRWAQSRRAADPEFFARLSNQQTPEYLWIGCSDSRVPATEIVGLLPGEIFVHRNVANLVIHTDLNCLSVLQYAVEVLKVRHIIVCGHYGCGGIRAALSPQGNGLIDNWLRHIKDIAEGHREQLAALAESARTDRLCELNVLAQVAHVCQTTIVQKAWKQGQSLAVHGWIYAVSDGLLHDLGTTIDGPDTLPALYRLSR